LDASGFAIRRRSVNDSQLDGCLRWLANFHATFLVDTKASGSSIHEGLWQTGTYWHLETRPDELKAMPDGPLKQAANKIDSRLANARFQTIVHGDAKLANFCFSHDDQVAAVDFQYVGGGCGMKDVAYFISSCFSDRECEQREQELLDRYFSHLKTAITNPSHGGTLDSHSFNDLETEWRSLYSFAWADFYRFLSGWSPGHWKMHGYSERMTERALKALHV
jgi:thiamine kinase-like enzyme